MHIPMAEHRGWPCPTDFPEARARSVLRRTDPLDGAAVAVDALGHSIESLPTQDSAF